ncbi:helix-turn-helix transcriptional regulator [Bacillus sp. SS-TM]
MAQITHMVFFIHKFFDSHKISPKFNQATRLIRLPEVLERTGYGKAWIYRLINDGKFPAPVKIGSRAIAFVESEIDTWIQSVIETSRNNVALIEIVFNARNEENVPYYRIEDDEEEDALRTMLLDILKTGQQNGVFSDSFQTDTLASFILGAIEERMLKANSSISIENYSDELIKMVKKLTV